MEEELVFWEKKIHTGSSDNLSNRLAGEAGAEAVMTGGESLD